LRGYTLANYPLSGYSIGGGNVSSAASSTEKDTAKGKWPLQRHKRAYLDYIGTKREEIDEQQDARRILHGSQWTQDQLNEFKKRRQPTTTNNKIVRKIDGIIGTLERLKQDPKAFPRTPMHEDGAELATGAIRYAMDVQNWSAKDPICARMTASEGFGGLEFNLITGDKGDVEVEIAVVQTDSFFYDPRSYSHDFSDARYMGVGKWMDVDSAIDLFPDYEEEIRDSVETGSELTSEPDREFKWFQSHGEIGRVRVVENWYKSGGKWHYCIFTGNTKLMEGESYLVDEKGQTQNKYEMFSCYIDQDGDRYGFVRNLKPLQQQINYRESKTIQLMHTRQLMAPQGAFDDVEVARREAARPDGVIIYNQGIDKPEFGDASRQSDIAAQFKYLENVKTDFESFGPNIAVTGEGLENSSGRAIQLLQQSGLADLGPFIQSYRDWKIRVYRKMWNAIQKHWTGERWIRVSDDDNVKQLVGINQVENGPFGPQLVNAIGSLDVDIILDEGPDTVNQMGDAYDTLSALAQKGAEIPPAILIELSPIQSSLKKKLLEMLNPTDPESQQKQQAMEQLQMKQAEADVMDKMASAQMKQAQATKALAEANAPPDQQMGDDPMKVSAEVMESQAKVAKTEAEIEKIRMDTEKTRMEIQLEPVRMQMEQQQAAQKMQMDEQRMASSAGGTGGKSAIKTNGKTYDLDQITHGVETANTVAKQMDMFAKGIDAIGQNVASISNEVGSISKEVRAISGEVAGIKEDMASPATIERDSAGRAVGITKGKRRMKIQRGVDGRMSGAAQ
jgi:hypothetical protein